jgi:MFS family permease
MAEISDHHGRGRGRTMGQLGAAVDAGSIAGPILAGFVWSAWGVGALFAVRIAVAVLAELYAWLILPRATARSAEARAKPLPAQ